MITAFQKEIDKIHEAERQFVYQNKVKRNFWHDLNNEPYGLLDAYAFTQKQLDEIRKVTEAVAKVYDKMASILRMVPDETLIQLGIPEQVIPFLREKALSVEGIIRRIDLVKTKNGWKNYEINSDTPTFIQECHYVNGIIATHCGYQDANEGSEKQLSDAVTQYVKEASRGKKEAKVVFTGFKEDVEDWNTILYIAELCRVPHEVVAIDELMIREGEGLFTPDGEKIDVLYRQTYPVEHLIYDESENGTLVGIELLKLVKEGKLSILNPLSAFLLQSKAVQALIWGLHKENHPYFTEEEHGIIEQHFIPTYLEKDYFLENGIKFVEKPSFGREGDTVVIYDEKGVPINENQLKSYDDSLKIYQEYTELPKGEVMTPYGKTEAHLLVGSFVIGTEAGAIGIRAGEKITGNESCFLAVGIKEEE